MWMRTNHSHNNANVRSVPTTVIEENGVEVDRFVGGLPKESVIQKLRARKISIV